MFASVPTHWLHVLMGSYAAVRSYTYLPPADTCYLQLVGCLLRPVDFCRTAETTPVQPLRGPWGEAPAAALSARLPHAGSRLSASTPSPGAASSRPPLSLSALPGCPCLSSPARSEDAHRAPSVCLPASCLTRSQEMVMRHGVCSPECLTLRLPGPDVLTARAAPGQPKGSDIYKAVQPIQVAAA